MSRTVKTLAAAPRTGLASTMMDQLMGWVIAALITVVGAMIYAGCIRWFKAPESGIAVFTPCIKAVAALFGGFFASRRYTGRGWLRGMMCGVTFALLAHILFWAASGYFSAGLVVLVDMLLAGAAGALGGIIAVNMRRR